MSNLSKSGLPNSQEPILGNLILELEQMVTEHGIIVPEPLQSDSEPYGEMLRRRLQELEAF